MGSNSAFATMFPSVLRLELSIILNHRLLGEQSQGEENEHFAPVVF